jgi:hypothetical protein
MNTKIFSCTRKNLIQATSLGALLALLVILTDVAGYLSRWSVFDQIQLDMPSSQALRVLRSNEISCDMLPSAYRCRFDDFWREYTIIIDAQQARVTRRAFVFKRHNSSILAKSFSFFDRR